ncbi:Hypothetical protein PHPALM_4231 [Phytophthora palmivora]|uniref:PiggyBac transposable element-derived protein domain-containing protein n=1 Tax=Phytophthora palmivora TaxID=4796 RepID=A0A2P4YKB1_9STRA|nr:Hypothetical protein PHPALM_4231 [Phytophthora palmivora]
MIPSRSRHNVTRQYMKDKPHKWGTKLFMTCCANTAYWLRLEVFCGKDQHESELGGGSPSKYSADPNSGPAAVVRNLHELLRRNVYSIGTIQANKAGFPKEVTVEYATRPRDIPRGSTKMAIMKNVPQMTSLLWWDRMPVQILATGASRTMQTCDGCVAEKIAIPCQSMMRDYHRWMGGVDIYDQLRLQRYSLQLAGGSPQADHAKFLRLLQAQMLELTAIDFANVTLSPAQPNQTDTAARVPVQHKLATFQAWSLFGKEKEHRKRPQHQRKVCSLRKREIGERCASRFFCAACSDGDKFVYMCDRVRPAHYPGNTLTCFQIWHSKWKNGSERPRPLVGRDIQMRGLGKKGKKKRRRSSANQDEDEREEDAAEEVEAGDALQIVTISGQVIDMRLEVTDFVYPTITVSVEVVDLGLQGRDLGSSGWWLQADNTIRLERSLESIALLSEAIDFSPIAPDLSTTVARNGDKYTDALREGVGRGKVSVRLADGTVVNVPEVRMDLAIKFEDFDSTESFLVLDMDKYDLILGMPWLEKHEPWIDWRGKAIGASLQSPTELW